MYTFITKSRKINFLKFNISFLVPNSKNAYVLIHVDFIYIYIYVCVCVCVRACAHVFMHHFQSPTFYVRHHSYLTDIHFKVFIK